MGFNIDRLNGQNYSENIIDPLLYFNDGNYTVTSGTGTATLDEDVFFVGSKSLYIENNTPAIDLLVNNTEQSTIATQNGNYQFSFYMFKDFPLEVRELDVLIYKGVALLDTQTFTIGSTDSDLDENAKWVRFQSDKVYDFKADQEITFQFKLKSSVTTELTTSVNIDGLMLNYTERNNSIVPCYVKPIGLGAQSFGTYDYQDTATTSTPIALVTDTWTDLTNNGLGVNTSSNPLPNVDIYNPLTGLFNFSGLEVGDWINLRVDVSPVLVTSNNVIDLEFVGGIGGTQFEIPFVSDKYYKTSGTKRITVYIGIEIKTASTLTYPAKLRIKCDSVASCIVNGWLVKVDKRNVRN